jgi:hypothetical protein
MWHQQMINSYVPVSDEMITTKARDYFGPLCGVPSDFKYSHGWLDKFKKRHGISFRIICGESGSAPLPEKIEEDRQLIRKVLGKYQLSDIFNLDETALFYRLPPNKTIANKNEKLQGIKQSKDRLSVAVIVSASGEEFIKPIVIGHHRKPRCFSSVTWWRSLCSLKIFEEWLLDFKLNHIIKILIINNKMKNESRKVLL